MTEFGILVALLLFQVKHYLADFQWQSGWMVRTKGEYGHIGGLAHAGLHGALSLPVLVLVAPWMPLLFVAIVIAEIVLHYHIDWFKASFMSRNRIDQSNVSYWRFLGLDQAAHHTTYIGILAVLVYLTS